MPGLLHISAAVIRLERRIGKHIGARMEEDGILTWRNAAGALVTLAIAVLAAGYLGWLHPLGDSLAVGRAFAVMGVLFAAVLASLAGMQMASFAATLFALICGLQVFLAYFVPGPPGRVLVYQKNILYRNADLAALEADIRAARPTLVTLQEVSEANLVLLENLRDAYPAQQRCPGGKVGGEAVLSRLAMVAGTGFCAPGLAAMQVIDGDHRFWVVSLHLHWPYPYQQAEHVRMLLPVLARLKGPVITGGDFNMVVWADAVKKLAAVTESEAAGPTFGTYDGLSPWLSLPIDHVLAPTGGRVIAREALGSDHLGLLAQVEP